MNNSKYAKRSQGGAGRFGGFLGCPSVAHYPQLRGREFTLQIKKKKKKKKKKRKGMSHFIQLGAN